jgi:hypothetical protein
VPPRESLRQEAARRGVSLYQVRKERGARENLTARTSVGHGPLPVKVARAVERQRKGHPRALPVRTQERYRQQIVQYERRRYGRLVTGKPRPRAFDSEYQARMWARTNQLTDVVESYGEIREEGGQWIVYLMR